jgi:DnaJ-class molecular chaperone
MDETKNIESQFEDDINAGFTTRRVEVVKSRNCLKCREPFSSEWSGERVCKRCKSSGTWRSGL